MPQGRCIPYRARSVRGLCHGFITCIRKCKAKFFTRREFLNKIAFFVQYRQNENIKIVDNFLIILLDKFVSMP